MVSHQSYLQNDFTCMCNSFSLALMVMIENLMSMSIAGHKRGRR